MSHIEHEMTAEDVISFLILLEAYNIKVQIDGGWGVDALLGEQTRKHSDLDIAVEHKDVVVIRMILEEKGYKDVIRDDTRDCNFVLGDDEGHLIDFHSYTFNENNEIIFGIPYPYESLKGQGYINGRSVACITPEWMVQFHTGYELDENDYHDVKLLCEKYNLQIPEDFKPFFSKDII